MAKAEPGLISRERFDTNADLLIFPDRHEYRTRSRIVYRLFGVVSILCLLASIGSPVFALIAEAPAETAGGASFFRIGIYLISPLFLASAFAFSWFTFRAFTFGPRLIVDRDGLKFVRWAPKGLRFRLRQFRVPFDEIEDIQMFVKGDSGQRGNRATSFRHGVEIFSENEPHFNLPWTSYEESQAIRFRDALVKSIEEMVSRSEGGPYR